MLGKVCLARAADVLLVKIRVPKLKTLFLPTVRLIRTNPTRLPLD